MRLRAWGKTRARRSSASAASVGFGGALLPLRLGATFLRSWSARAGGGVELSLGLGDRLLDAIELGFQRLEHVRALLQLAALCFQAVDLQRDRTPVEIIEAGERRKLLQQADPAPEEPCARRRDRRSRCRAPACGPRVRRPPSPARRFCWRWTSPERRLRGRRSACGRPSRAACRRALIWPARVIAFSSRRNSSRLAQQMWSKRSSSSRCSQS